MPQAPHRYDAFKTSWAFEVFFPPLQTRIKPAVVLKYTLNKGSVLKSIYSVKNTLSNMGLEEIVSFSAYFLFFFLQNYKIGLHYYRTTVQ